MAERADMAELTAGLRAAADAHLPDRERMLARIERAMDAPPTVPQQRDPGRTGAPWMRVTAVTAAVAGAIGLGGLAVGAVTGDGEPTQSVVTSQGPTRPQPPPAAAGESGSPSGERATPRRSGRPPGHRGGAVDAPHSAAPTTTTPTASATATAPPATTGTAPATSPPEMPTQGGTLSAQGSVNGGSNSYWTQNDVTLTSSQPITSLVVELRVARTPGVDSSGSWTSAPDATTASVTEEGEDLVYRWTLDAGRTLSPGTYTFSGQFQHDEGVRDTSGDGWSAQTAGPDGSASLGGGF